MPIVWAESGGVEELRGRVLAELQEKKAADPSYRVIDVGGVYKPWADAVTDAYVDIQGSETEKRLFLGDICEPTVWETIRAEEPPYDFAICTHVFEDIRDPLFVSRQLASIARAGFVSTPTKHTEFSNVESSHYLGYCHHRWIFTARETERETTLLGIGKFPVTGYFNSRWRPLVKLFHFFGRVSLLAKVERRLGVFPGGSGVHWVDRSLVGHDKELGVRWDGDLPLRLINNDFSGLTCLAAADLYRYELADGI